MGTFLPAHGFCQCSSKRLECCDLKSSFAFSKAMPSKREKRDKSRKEDKNTANKKRRAAAKRFKADVPSGEEPMRDIMRRSAVHGSSSSSSSQPEIRSAWQSYIRVCQAIEAEL